MEMTYVANDGSRYRVPIAAINPCIPPWGPGPEGARCGSCDNLSAFRAGAQTLYYCQLSGQPKRVTWPACANFIEAPLIAPSPSGRAGAIPSPHHNGRGLG